MILEAVMLSVKRGTEQDFESTFQQAANIISAMNGYISHELHRCIEVEGRYLLLVKWSTLEAHTVGFRGSAEYQEWKKLLHHFYDPFPTVEHFQLISGGNLADKLP
ncbi:antibiotic biosynthesis monooxygenase [Nostoc sp. TCL26-01]|uniref:antibiotic biosynthesis monooxygenase family protein n=1 Tax=Nostoc sp. TCL26-01 TaxID=2576904 RepID=UPI0015BF526B|nr:antibiotic biosynthesis monooxygenase [Nostoc sp. TCL26-01]QLE56980.1 antibiotic biosynthesis monooxygenase [Nostoc sp. TCL26-01]